MDRDDKTLIEPPKMIEEHIGNNPNVVLELWKEQSKILLNKGWRSVK
jgi:hypothetical protein